MNIIYYCFAGAHASVVAAAIHCGLLPSGRIPEPEEFSALRYYDKTPPDNIGQPYFMGDDEAGNHVYFMGMRNQRENITAVIKSMLLLSGWQEDEYILQDAFPLINFSTKFGGLLSKRWYVTNLGRSLTIWGMRRQYPMFVTMVAQVKAKSGFQQEKE